MNDYVLWENVGFDESFHFTVSGKAICSLYIEWESVGKVHPWMNLFSNFGTAEHVNMSSGQ